MLNSKDWKDIPGYENYQINPLGEIQRDGKILKPQKRGDGRYLHIDLCKEGKTKSFRISRLVAMMYHGLDIDNKKLFACHKDDNPHNNREDNIFIGTAKDNSQDMVSKNRQGGFKNQGEKNGQCILSDEDVKDIRVMIAGGIKQKHIAKAYCISEATISALKHNKRRKGT